MQWENNSAWRNAIRLKYGIEEGWFTWSPRGTYGVGLWKAISKETVKLKQDCFLELGDGCKINFWEDVCCGDSSLRKSFPDDYNLAGTKVPKVAEVLENLGENGAWNPRSLRPFNDWEMETIQNFIS